MRSLETLLALLPRGRAWTRAVGSRLVAYMEAIAAEFDRLEARAADLLRESIPTGADELLEEWVTLTRANDCLVVGVSLEAQQQAAAARFISETPTLALVRETIEAQGYSPEFFFFTPFRAGHSAAGDPLTNDAWQHTLGIRVTPRAPADDEALACLVQGLVQSHVFVLFEWVSEFDLVTDDGFDLVTDDGFTLIASE